VGKLVEDKGNKGWLIWKPGLLEGKRQIKFAPYEHCANKGERILSNPKMLSYLDLLRAYYKLCQKRRRGHFQGKRPIQVARTVAFYDEHHRLPKYEFDAKLPEKGDVVPTYLEVVDIIQRDIVPDITRAAGPKAACCYVFFLIADVLPMPEGVEPAELERIASELKPSDVIALCAGGARAPPARKPAEPITIKEIEKGAKDMPSERHVPTVLGTQTMVWELIFPWPGDVSHEEWGRMICSGEIDAIWFISSRLGAKPIELFKKEWAAFGDAFRKLPEYTPIEWLFNTFAAFKAGGKELMSTEAAHRKKRIGSLVVSTRPLSEDVERRLPGLIEGFWEVLDKMEKKLTLPPVWKSKRFSWWEEKAKAP